MIVLVIVWENLVIFVIGGKIVVFGFVILMILFNVWLVWEMILVFICVVVEVIKLSFNFGYINVLFVWLIW